MPDTITRFYRLEEAINCEMESDKVFILANERLSRDGRVGRFFTVFPNYDDFAENRDAYPHCHEILVDHQNCEPNHAGRLVFDFDIAAKDEIPETFKDDVETTVLEVVVKYYQDVDIDLLDFVWSHSRNPKKYSSHLTVKNLCFDQWIPMSKIFYQLFAKRWDRQHHWISSDKLVDHQIVRRNGSLRMTGSSKIGGYPLIMDNPEHTLEDSLIRLYRRKERKHEQILTRENILPSVLDKISWYSHEKRDKVFKEPRQAVYQEPLYEQAVYDKAFELVEYFTPGSFEPGKVSGAFFSVYRKQNRQGPAPCLISGIRHEHENAYVVVKYCYHDVKPYYEVYYGCYRKCGPTKTVCIGSINARTLRKSPVRKLKKGPRRPPEILKMI